MILELAEVPRERHGLGTRDVLVAKEEHLVLDQQRAYLGHEPCVARGHPQIDVSQFRADRARQRLDLDGTPCSR
jgi:hypothetical protein